MKANTHPTRVGQPDEQSALANKWIEEYHNISWKLTISLIRLAAGPDARLGVLARPVDSDNETKLRWADDDSISGYINVNELSKPEPEVPDTAIEGEATA
eukprot:SAG11_NODE_20016_length_454_cov_1.160563_1_plen_99_part_01